MYLIHFEQQKLTNIIIYAKAVGLCLLHFNDYLSHIRYIAEHHWKILLSSGKIQSINVRKILLESGMIEQIRKYTSKIIQDNTEKCLVCIKHSFF